MVSCQITGDCCRKSWPIGKSQDYHLKVVLSDQRNVRAGSAARRCTPPGRKGDAIESGIGVPCSQCAHSRCPAHRYRASSSNAVFDHTSRSESPACTTSTATSGQRMCPRQRSPGRCPPTRGGCTWPAAGPGPSRSPWTAASGRGTVSAADRPTASDATDSAAGSVCRSGPDAPAVADRPGRSMGTGSCAAVTGAAHSRVALPCPRPA
jgi:hypothetical protein